MNTKTECIDVLVVGAGPVGLAAALELSRRGIACELVDTVKEIDDWWTRAMNMNKRSMEHMRRWGVAQRIKEVNFVPPGWPGNVSISDSLGGRQLACARADCVGWHRTLDHSTEDALWVGQGQVQAVLLEAVQRSGVRVSFGQTAVALRELADDGVEVDVQPDDGPLRTIRARYLIGCDGGRSTVRRAAGIPVEGAGRLTRQVSLFFNAPTLLADLRRRGIADSVMYLSSDPAVRGTSRLIAGDRWDFTYRPEPDVDENTLDGEAVVRRLIGPDVAFRFERAHWYWYNEIIASRFQHGRIFLAGDAAHMIPPLGGHNLNLGFGDAVNLGWKLSHVLRGWADASILESYTPERLSMVRRTATEAYRNFERLRSTFQRMAGVMEIDESEPGGRARRDAMSKAVAIDLEPQWKSDGTVLDQRYEDSPIVPHEQAPVPAYDSEIYQPCARPGHRAPMWRDAAGKPLYDRFGPEYTLLDLTSSPIAGMAFAGELANASLPVTHVQVPDPALRQLYGADYALIRPDQHVAWRGNPQSTAADQLVSTIAGRRQLVAQ